MPISNGLAAWSYSRLSTYRKCPRQFHWKFILKKPVPEQKSPALERGNEIDQALQKFVEGKLKTLPASLRRSMGAQMVKEVQGFKKDKTASCQLELAVTKAWTPTGWFDGDAWLRAKLDVRTIVDLTRARVVDYKSGKSYPAQHTEQLEIYAAVSAAHVPTVTEILAEIFYVDLGYTTPALFSIKDIPRLRKKWEKLAAPMFRDTRWKPTPSNECSWCPFSQRKGGPCDKG